MELKKIKKIPQKIPKKIKKLCKKLHIRLTVKRGSKKVKKSLNILLKEIQRKKSKFGYQLFNKIKSTSGKGFNYVKTHKVKSAIAVAAIVGTAVLVAGTGGAAAPLAGAEISTLAGGAATAGTLANGAKSALSVKKVAVTTGQTMNTALNSVAQVESTVDVAKGVSNIVPHGNPVPQVEKQVKAANIAAISADNAVRDVGKATNLSSTLTSDASKITQNKNITNVHNDVKEVHQEITDTSKIATQAKEHAINANNHVEEAKHETDPHKKQESLKKAVEETRTSIDKSAEVGKVTRSGLDTVTDGIDKTLRTLTEVQRAKELVTSIVPHGSKEEPRDEESEQIEEYKKIADFKIGKRTKFGHYIKNKKIIDNLKKDYRLIKKL